MKYYRELDISKVSFFEESVLWLILGELPEAFYGESGEEARTNLEDIQNEHSLGSNFFEENDYEVLGVEVNFKRYNLAAYDYPGFSTVAGFREHYSRMKNSGHVGFGDISDSELAEVEYVETIDQLVAAKLDVGRIKLLDQLLCSNLTAYGFISYKQHSDEDEYFDSIDWDPEKIELSQIPASDWSINGFDQNADVLLTNDKSYFRVHFNTGDLLKVFPDPLCKGHVATGKVHGRSLILDVGPGFSNTNRSSLSKRTAKNKNIRVLTKEFSRRKKAGELGKKREAVYAEAIEWADNILDWNVSRTSVQRYLEKIFE